MTKEDWVKIAAHIESASGHKFDKLKLKAWFDVLGDLPADAVAAASKRCLQECESAWPQPATIRRMAVEWQNGVTDGADQAWERVLAAVRAYGHYSPREGMNSLDELTQLALRAAGGFQWACEVGPENRTVLAAQFRRAYEATCERFQRQRVLSDDVKPRRAIESTVKKLVHKLPDVPDA